MKLLLIGAGNMGSALYASWAKKFDIVVLEKNEETKQALKARFADIRFTDDSNADGMVVVLAVKPQSFDTIELIGKPKAVVSIMAGVKLERIKAQFEADSFVRAMPNLAALYAKSATALTGDESFRSSAIELFDAVGKSIWLESEEQLNIATALAGSGPAFLAVVAEAMANGAVKLGLKSSDAHELTKALFEGMGDLLTDHPAILKEKVSSPAGTTVSGIAKLEEMRVRHAFYEALKAAYDRAKELG